MQKDGERKESEKEREGKNWKGRRTRKKNLKVIRKKRAAEEEGELVKGKEIAMVRK